ncbi:MAG: threonine--tRNA ligase [Clostridiales bacterium]|nr:threonine--tRNA ligase [Clostridiales bacterium]
MKVILGNGEIIESAFSEETGRNALRHTAAHILAQAVKGLYPNAKCATGQATNNGFYYDFEFDFVLTAAQLPLIETEMKRIVEAALPIEYCTVNKDDAICEMGRRKEDYKRELLAEMPEDTRVSYFRQGDFADICSGPHVTNTKEVKAFKLTSLAGAYWRGDEKNKMLTRIYGTAFQSQDELEEHLKSLEEAKARDHRKIGKEMELFAIMEEGPGFIFFLPKGLILKNLLIDYWRRLHEREGYIEVSTPIILKRELWETSGHWDNYRDIMYTLQIDDMDFAIKPMSCPGGMLIYKMKPHSYKELPIRMAELGLVHRNEKSGTLHGLNRVRALTQDDAHIFMMREQVIDEVKGVIRLVDEVYRKFDFKYHVELSTRPEKSIGTDEEWEEATNALRQALDDIGLPYVINEGDGAFYGPKIDFHLEDSIGRTWQCGTIQLDLQMPQRFNLEYIGTDGEKHRPIMIHRAIFGSLERFIGILIEHYAGKFPVWLSPVQVKVLPVSGNYIEYAAAVADKLKAAGIRCELDARDEKLGYKIREARLERVPYMVVVGGKEQESETVTVRGSDEGDIGNMSVKDFIKKILDECN